MLIFTTMRVNTRIVVLTFKTLAWTPLYNRVHAMMKAS